VIPSVLESLCCLLVPNQISASICSVPRTRFGSQAAAVNRLIFLGFLGDFRPPPGLSLRCHRVGQRAQALDFPAPAYCVSQLLSTCFEFSHPCVHPFVISATAFFMLVMSEGALSQFLLDLVKVRFSFPRQDLAA
jgi:hypothetical protein